MTLKNCKDRGTGKRIYEKPELKSFSLKADEVMAGNCKVDTFGSTGPGGPCTLESCAKPGS